MNKEIFFSIVVPVYGSEVFFEECINSVLNQKNVSFELILVDDESPDNCPKICDKYLELDNRVVVIHQKNSGVSAACNNGFKIAKGKYIIQLDNDDFLSDNILEKIKNKIQEQNNPDIIQCNWARVFNGEYIYDIQKIPSNQEKNKLNHLDFVLKNYSFWRYPIAFWSIAIKSEYLNSIDFKFKSEFDAMQDQEAFFDCFTQTQDIYYFDEVLTYHRMLNNSLSVRPNYNIVIRRIDFYIKCFSRFDNEKVNENIIKLYKQLISYFINLQIDNIYSFSKEEVKQFITYLGDKENIINLFDASEFLNLCNIVDSINFHMLINENSKFNTRYNLKKLEYLTRSNNKIFKSLQKLSRKYLK